MISKRVLPQVWFGEMPTTNLLQVHARGVDKMQKFASATFVERSDIRPERGYSFVHVISMGAGEFYGSNSNADFFNEKSSAVEVPEHYRTGRPQAIVLAEGLSKYHSTFMKYGSVYREHHNSKKGGKSQGALVAEYYCPTMHRGELILKLANDSWSDDLQKLAKGEPVYWSMGAGVPYDLCSWCGNPAKTRKEYCDHMKFQKLAILKDGNQVFCYNDQPHLHDISRVRVPAARIAFALSKVASGIPMQDVDQMAEGLWLPLSMIKDIGSDLEQKYAEIFHKAADIEKRIMVRGMCPEESALSEAFMGGDVDPETLKELKKFPVEDTLAKLSSCKILLPPRSFACLVLKKEATEINGIKDLPYAVRRVFSEVADNGDADVFSDASYVTMTPRYWSGLEKLCGKLAPEFSIEDEAVQRRLIQSSIGGGPRLHKRASLLVTPTLSAESQYLAREYAKYQVSFLAGAGVNKYVSRIVVHNQASS